MKNTPMIEIIDDIAAAVVQIVVTILVAVFAALPFILFQDQETLEFWQSLGYFGMYMWGLSAIMRGAGRRPRA